MPGSFGDSIFLDHDIQRIIILYHPLKVCKMRQTPITSLFSSVFLCFFNTVIICLIHLMWAVHMFSHASCPLFCCKFFEIGSWDCVKYLRCRFQGCLMLLCILFCNSFLNIYQFCLHDSNNLIYVAFPLAMGFILYFMTVSQSNVTFATL